MLKQGQYLKQLQKLSPQQIQFMKLLQIPTASIEERIKEEIEANPALEEGVEEDDELKEVQDVDLEPTSMEGETNNDKNQEAEADEYDTAEEDRAEADDTDLSDYLDEDEVADYKLAGERDPNDEDDTRSSPLPLTKSFHEYLKEQLLMLDLDEKEEKLAHYIVGSIDEDGYLRRSLDAMVDDILLSTNITTSEKVLESLLKKIQFFDPPGTGARTLQECLLIQLDRQTEHPELIEPAKKVIEENFEEFVKKHYEKIQRRLNVDDEEFKQIMELILRLNPKPGSAYAGSSTTETFLLPDFYVTNNDGELELQLNGINVPDLRISSTFKDMLRDYSLSSKKDKKQKEAVMFIKQRIDSAKWFIDAIRQRQQTLLLTMRAILDYQKDYFLTGDDTKLRPMILKDIADIIGMDISTVSRVANSKYVQTEFGTFKLKSFFSESLSTESGEEVSTREVKKILTDLIAAENKNKPLSDEKLTQLLNDKGYNIARRTVAKYREQLDIPVARLRRQL